MHISTVQNHSQDLFNASVTTKLEPIISINLLEVCNDVFLGGYFVHVKLSLHFANRVRDRICLFLNKFINLGFKTIKLGY